MKKMNRKRTTRVQDFQRGREGSLMFQLAHHATGDAYRQTYKQLNPPENEHSPRATFISRTPKHSFCQPLAVACFLCKVCNSIRPLEYIRLQALAMQEFPRRLVSQVLISPRSQNLHTDAHTRPTLIESRQPGSGTLTPYCISAGLKTRGGRLQGA